MSRGFPLPCSSSRNLLTARGPDVSSTVGGFRPVYFAAFDPRLLSEVGSPAPFFQFTPHLMVSRHFGLTDYPRARVRPQGSAPPQQGNRGSPPVLLRLHSGWTPPFACFRGSGGLTSGSYLVVWVALGSKGLCSPNRDHEVPRV